MNDLALWSGALVRVATAAAFVAIFDLASKAAAVALLDEPVEMTGFLSLRVVRNDGMAFGIGTWLPPAAILALTAAICLPVVWAVSRRQLEPRLAGILILGGAAANIVDRALDGSVVDMIDVGRWPTFNLADVFIVSGVGLTLLRSISPHKEEDEAPTEFAPGSSPP